jgi:sulfur relay (sulfurtransferase) DsrC/TusE family protein
MSDLRDELLDFMKDYYSKNDKPPSILTIRKKVKGATVRQFYKIFEGGIKEACSTAGI